ncbi:MAG: FHA domain-containing protein [Hyphomicrobiaceae bacterium]
MILAIVLLPSAGEAGSAGFRLESVPVFAQGSLAETMSTVWAAVNRIGSGVSTWAVENYRRSPAIMIGLSGLVLLPPLALLGLILKNRASRNAYLADMEALSDRACPEPIRSAWLIAGGETSQGIVLDRDLVQIGRQEDNDICLSDATVHRYHAVIERMGDEEFVIIDMSGPNGNGVRVNGERWQRRALVDGDVVELGKVRLRFATAA